MEYPRGEERHANLPSNTMVKIKTFSPLLVLMMLLYPTLLGFVFVARLATFALIIPTPTVPGGASPVAVAPISSDSDAGKLHGAADLWETAGAGALVRTAFAFISITFVHLFLVSYLVLGPPGVSFMETHRLGRLWTVFAATAFWFTTTCFFVTYTSMARYGAHGLEWCLVAIFSVIILAVTAPVLSGPPAAEKVVVRYPPRAMVYR